MVKMFFYYHCYHGQNDQIIISSAGGRWARGSQGWLPPTNSTPSAARSPCSDRITPLGFGVEGLGCDRADELHALGCKVTRLLIYSRYRS